VTGSTVVRAFSAFEIPEAVRAHLETTRDHVRRTLPAARWTRPEGWHLTVKFLGERRRDVLEKMACDLRGRLEGCGAVTATLAGGGFFPSPARPRVAWIGGSVVGADRIVTCVEAAAVRVGVSREKRPWAVHLTMARLKSRWSGEAVDRYLEWAQGLESMRFVCSDVVLFESRLQPGGAVYTALERIPLE
jgi:2'-5' RNA ligase